MALPTNDDLPNCELSMEELDAIAAAGIWRSIGNWIGSSTGKWVLGGFVAASWVGTALLGIFVG